MKQLEQVFVKNRGEWRNRLAEHHRQEDGIWLIFFRKSSGKLSLDYREAVEEALCFGWIDSTKKKIDDIRYAYKFTPRKANSKWSRLNKERAEKMIRAGRMTEFGWQKINAAKKSGYWDNPHTPPAFFTIPPEFEHALAENKQANAHFKNLAPGYQKQFIGWIATAKRPETRQRRIREAIELLELGKKLGMK